MYLTYDEYAEMGGSLNDVTFDDFAWEAKTIIDWYTFKRLEKDEIRCKEAGKPIKHPEAVKRCMFRLIQLAQQKAEIMALASPGGGGYFSASKSAVGSPTIASQSNDGVSISYNIMSASEVFGILNSKENGNLMEDTVKRYLHGVVDSLGRKVLYRGLYPDE